MNADPARKATRTTLPNITRYLYQLVDSLQKQQAAKEERLLQLEQAKKDILLRHGECIQGENQPCESGEHAEFKTLQMQLASQLEQSNRLGDQISECCALLGDLGPEEDKERALVILGKKDQYIAELTQDIADYASSMIELSSVVLDFEKACKSRSLRIEVLETELDELRRCGARLEEAKGMSDIARAGLLNENSSLREKVRRLEEELRLKEETNGQLLQKSHLRLQRAIEDCNQVSQRQTSTIKDRESQVAHLKEAASSLEEKLELIIRENMQLQKLLLRLTEQSTDLREGLETAWRASAEMGTRHQEQLALLASEFQSELDCCRTYTQERQKQLLCQQEELARQNHEANCVLYRVDSQLARLLGDQAESASLEQKMTALETQFLALEEQVRKQSLSGDKVQSLQEQLDRKRAQCEQLSRSAQAAAQRERSLHRGQSQQSFRLKHLEDQKQKSYFIIQRQAAALIEYKQQIVDLVANEKRLQDELRALAADNDFQKRRYGELKLHLEAIEEDYCTREQGLTKELSEQLEQLRKELRSKNFMLSSYEKVLPNRLSI